MYAQVPSNDVQTPPTGQAFRRLRQGALAGTFPDAAGSLRAGHLQRTERHVNTALKRH
jgi:hypothetical protein